MKRFNLLTLFLFLLLFSCQKKELFHDLHPSKPKPAFIDLNTVKNDLLKPIAGELNRQDSLYGIQEYFNKKYGTFLWDQALSKQRDRNILAIIPFTKSNENVEGFIIAKLVDGKFNYELFNKASVITNGFKEVAGKRNNYEIQLYFDYFNLKIYKIDKRPLLHFMQIRDTVQRRKFMERNGAGDVRGIFIKYSFPHSNLATQCYDFYESVEIWWNPNGDPCNCDGDEVYDHTEFEKKTECYDTSTPGGGSGGGGGEGGPTTGLPGPSTDPNSPFSNPNITWLYAAGNQTDTDSYGTLTTDNSWANAMMLDWDAPPPPNQNPFSTVQLLNYGANRGWQAGIVRNRKCGKFFEESALKYFGLTANGKNYNSAQRIQSTGNSVNPKSAFRPDGIGGTQYFYTDANKGMTIITLDNYFMAEVKATSGTLALNTNNYQIEAELDFLKKRRIEAEASTTVPIKVKPVFFLITTSDAVVSNEIINYANANKIWVWQSTAKYIADPNTGSPIITYTWPVWLAAPSSNYTTGTQVPAEGLHLIPAYAPGTFVDRTAINPEPGPNYDLDPEEVD